MTGKYGFTPMPGGEFLKFQEKELARLRCPHHLKWWANGFNEKDNLWLIVVGIAKSRRWSDDSKSSDH